MKLFTDPASAFAHTAEERCPWMRLRDRGQVRGMSRPLRSSTHPAISCAKVNGRQKVGLSSPRRAVVSIVDEWNDIVRVRCDQELARFRRSDVGHGEPHPKRHMSEIPPRPQERKSSRQTRLPDRIEPWNESIGDRNRNTFERSSAFPQYTRRFENPKVAEPTNAPNRSCPTGVRGTVAGSVANSANASSSPGSPTPCPGQHNCSPRAAPREMRTIRKRVCGINDSSRMTSAMFGGMASV